MLTPETLKELRALGDKATHGAWTWEANPPTLYAGRDNEHHGLNLLGRLDPDGNTPANLDFITAAKNHWTALLDAAERATEGDNMSLSHHRIECACEACEREREEALTPKRLKQIREYAAERAAQGAYGVVPIHVSWVNQLLDAAEERSDFIEAGIRIIELERTELRLAAENAELKRVVQLLQAETEDMSLREENAELKRRLAELTEWNEDSDWGE